MIWAQVFPFVALQLYEGREKTSITTYLGDSFVLCLTLNLMFFLTIDMSYAKTFFTRTTAPQYTCELFLTSQEDSAKFRAAFKNRTSYTRAVHGEVKEWVANNIDDWIIEKPAWFRIEKIEDEFLPVAVYEAEGGAERERSVLGLRELVGFARTEDEDEEEQPDTLTALVMKWKTLAEEIYESRSNDQNANFQHIQRVFGKNGDLVAPLLERSPKVSMILAFVLVQRLGMKVKPVDFTSDMKNFSVEDCRRIGRSMATLLRTRRHGKFALEAWRLEYAQLGSLFDEVEGFEEFMVVIVGNLLRDNKYAMAYRVGIGAALSLIDTATDLYVISTYYQSDALITQANALVAMISMNLFIQLLVVLANYGKKSWENKLKEVAISVLFFRPIVDAYRVSTNQEDEDTTFDCLTEMLINKGIELATESIPGCVLQLYVWLDNPEDAGAYALLSVGISALTTGYTSSIIAFDFDTDVLHRKNQPEMYGYIPDYHELRGRCFTLMTLMSALHNLSRSLGCALLIVSGGGTTAGERVSEAKQKGILRTRILIRSQ